MLYLALSILFSVLLLVNFRLFPKYDINTTQAISLNYIVCFITGLILMPKGQSFSLDLSQNWTWYCLILGVGFIITFLLSGLATQRMGMTATSLANNVSLVLPVMASLFLFNTDMQFDAVNYLGLACAFVALILVSIKKETASAADLKSVGVSGGLLVIAVFLMYGVTNTAINFLNLNFIPNPDLTIPVTLVMVLGAMIAGLCLFAYTLWKEKKLPNKQTLIASITLGVPNFLSFFLLILALTAFGNSGAFVYPIYNIGVILVSSVIGILFFREKLSPLNYTGLGIAFLAIVLISHQSIF
ncbi:MAG: EamA/RhaT family transporter [Spirosomaceae bacterium]|nr:EamA/RhaT family transporter [Spirosomataceae bacterium]